MLYANLEIIDATGEDTKVLTNADRVRIMSDEELAEFRTRGLCPPSRSFPDCTMRGSCSKCWLEYLRQFIKDGDK